ncbi:hypothetical protein ACHHYP_00344 [Achlya hypogyna]|uniref:Cyclin-like domain-containing protein n=1 Tax=Achlya hypogyna TaxID=1202772 RepID=A0A1V9ZUN3_ACHHY|nr:hypothetical protein ACHHYP_00344 [Achlya hypogyna]
MDLLCHEDPAVSTPESTTPPNNNDAILSLEAIEDTLAVLRATEARSMANPKYIHDVQTDGMTAEWRANVVGWMTNVAGMLNFEVKTTALAMNYFDRFLSERSVEKPQVEVLALACVLAASKFNEQDALTITEAVAISGDHEAATIVAAEKDLLKTLNWQLHAVLPHHFLECHIERLEADATVLDLCLDLLSRTAVDMKMLAFPPSTLAVACLSVAFSELHMPFPAARFEADMVGGYRACKAAVAAIARPAPAVAECATPTAPTKLKRSASPSGVEDVYECDSPVVIKRQRLYSA